MGPSAVIGDWIVSCAMRPLPPDFRPENVLMATAILESCNGLLSPSSKNWAMQSANLKWVFGRFLHSAESCSNASSQAHPIISMAAGPYTPGRVIWLESIAELWGG